jgi:hypothetical protein
MKMFVSRIVVSVLSWTLILAITHKSKSLLDQKSSPQIQVEKSNHTRINSILALMKSKFNPSLNRTQFQKSQDDMDILGETNTPTKLLKTDKQHASTYHWNQNKTSPEIATNVSTVGGIIDTHMEEMNISDVLKDILKRSTVQTICFLSERSTCPWYYDDNGDAHCNYTIPIGCDPNHCLLRCHLLYDSNRSIACISTAPCLIQAVGQSTASCR